MQKIRMLFCFSFFVLFAVGITVQPLQAITLSQQTLVGFMKRMHLKAQQADQEMLKKNYSLAAQLYEEAAKLAEEVDLEQGTAFAGNFYTQQQLALKMGEPSKGLEGDTPLQGFIGEDILFEEAKDYQISHTS